MENTALHNLVEFHCWVESKPDIFKQMKAYEHEQPYWSDLANTISKFYINFKDINLVTEELEVKINNLAGAYLAELNDFWREIHKVEVLTKEGKKARRERIAAKKAQTQAEQERADLIAKFILFLDHQSKNKVEYQDRLLKNFLPLIPKKHNEKIVYGDFEITRVNTVFAIFGDSGNKIVFRKIKK